MYIRITKTDSKYPAELRNLCDPPLTLHMRGCIEALELKPRVGIVGSRHMTEYGQRVIRAIIPFLVRCGCVIVSGLAYGVDAESHKTMLACDGIGIAVLGSGVDDITPRGHYSLGESVIKKGLLISEYPPKTPAHKSHFPARNRIIAGLSDVLIVVEGALHSGSLITADFMLQLGKDVFAIPGPIDAPYSQGPLFLLRHGAHLLVEPQQITECLGIDKVPSTSVLSELSPDEQRIYTTLQSPLRIDDISRACTLPASKVSGSLTALELKGYVQKTANGLFTRK